MNLQLNIILILLLTYLKICLKKPRLKKGAVPTVMLNLIKSCEENQKQKFSAMPIVEKTSWSDENNSCKTIQFKINLCIRKMYLIKLHLGKCVYS